MRTSAFSVLAAISMLLLPLGCASTPEAEAEQFVVTKSLDVTIEPLAMRDGAHAPERVVVENGNGSIVLESIEGLGEVRIAAALRVDGASTKESEQRLLLTRLFAERSADGTIVVRAMFPGKRMPRDRADLVVKVPRAGDASLRTDTGTITTMGTEGSLRVASKNGAVRVEGHDGAVDATASNGAITLQKIGGAVHARAANGDIDLVHADGNTSGFDVECRNGRARVEVASAFEGVVRLVTENGQIRVEDPAGRASKSDAGSRVLVATIGGGGKTSRVDSGNGAVVLVVRPRTP